MSLTGNPKFNDNGLVSPGYDLSDFVMIQRR